MEDGLRLVSKPGQLKPANSFWRCCVLKREYLPEVSCPEGQSTRNEEPKCPWWINSPEHHFCFWRYIKDKSDPDGIMKELVQSELATLFNWSTTKTHFMLKQAMTELTAALKAHGALELLRELDHDESESQVQLDDFIDANQDEPSE